jgi:hypothetical protein
MSTTGHILTIIIVTTIPCPSYQSTQHALHIAHYSTISHILGNVGVLLLTETSASLSRYMYVLMTGLEIADWSWTSQ